MTTTANNTMIGKISKNIMGTTSFEMKITGMRKMQDFIVYPITDATKPLLIQSDTRIGYLDHKTGKGIMSKSHSGGAYFHHLTLDVKQSFELTEMDLSALKMQIFVSADKNAGDNGVMFTDNSEAINIL